MSLDLAVAIAAQATTLLGPRIAELLTEKATGYLQEARKEYEQNRQPADSALELERERLLGHVNELQARVVLEVTYSQLIARLIAILIDQSTQIYKAKSLVDLRATNTSLNLIESTLERNRRDLGRRTLARWLAILVSIVAALGLGGIIFWGTQDGGPTEATIVPILNIPLPIILWSAIGSFTAILYRFNSSRDIELRDPLRWLFTRPVTGVVLGIVSFLIVKIGLLSLAPPSNTTDATPIDFGSAEILWLVAFICGFSDRFSDSLLKLLVGRLGGNAEKGLVSLDGLETSTELPSMRSLFGIFGLGEEKPSPGQSPGQSTQTSLPPPAPSGTSEQKQTPSTKPGIALRNQSATATDPARLGEPRRNIGTASTHGTTIGGSSSSGDGEPEQSASGG